MLNQSEGGGGNPLYLIIYLCGFMSYLIIFTVYKKVRERIEADNLPRVLLLDLTKFRLIAGGIFIGINRKIHIPVEDGNGKHLWGVRTDRYMIIPSHGNEEDIIIQDRGLPSIVVMICEVLGMSSHGEEVHKQWAKHVFPQEMYSIPQKLAELPPNYMFINPLGMRNWTKSMLKDQFKGLRHIYAQVYKILNKYDQTMEEMYSFYGDLLLQKIQSTNETILSGMQYAYDTWDVILRERTVPMKIMKQLLHIPLRKQAYTGLSVSMNHGGLGDAISWVGNLSRAAKGLVDTFGMVAVNKGLHTALIDKTNTVQEKLMEKEVENGEQMRMLQQLAGEVSNLRSQKRPQAVEAPVQVPPVSV